MPSFLKSLVTLSSVASALALPQRPEFGAHSKFRPITTATDSDECEADSVTTTSSSTATPIFASPTSLAIPSDSSTSESLSSVIATIVASTSSPLTSSSSISSSATVVVSSSSSSSAALSISSTSASDPIETTPSSSTTPTIATSAPLVSSSTSSAASTTTSATAIVKVGSQAATDLCGNQDYIILNDSPWIVYNMLYNADVTVGTQCTYYDYMTTASDGTAEVVWDSITDITYVESTNNVPKGYSFVGLTQNLETTIDAISSIPTTYTWERTNTTAFKGNVCYDFMTNDVKGDSTSTDSHELMLWLQYEGGQLPIGWDASSPYATIDSLFGTSWKLYQGVNSDTGITVSSLLPDTQFDGSFEGDLKDWLVAIANLGTFSNSTYVNVGNAGTEFFYGNAVMNATLALQIDLA